MADSVYLNGNFYTVSAKSPRAAAAGIREGNFVYVGSEAEARKYVGKGTEVIDLRGRTVVPGIIETHLHFLQIGTKLLMLDAFWRPKQEILRDVAEAFQRSPRGEWIQGHGWNQEVWDPNAFPTKTDLDSVCPDIPVVLVRTCGHALWINTRALEIAGISRNTPNPFGGEILRDEKGEPTGILTDTAMKLVRDKVPPFSREQKREAMRLAQGHLFSYGITTAHDAGAGMQDIEATKELYDRGDLCLRLQVRARVADGTELDVDGVPMTEHYKRGLQVGLFGNRLTIRGIKVSADGSLGARSAWMLGEYSDRPGHAGSGKWTDGQLYGLFKEARKAGFQISVHCIGSACNRQALNVFEKISREMPDPDHRSRIVHAQVLDPNDIPRFAKLGVIPEMQSVHATSDMNMAEERVGPNRIKGAYAWRKLIRAGNILPNGSDAPVELVNPFHGLYAAITRMDREGKPEGGWYPEECLTREEALKSFTTWGAYSSFEEKMKGSIEVGKLADFVVLDRDVMNCPAAEIKDTNVLITIVGGKIAYQIRGGGM